LVIETFPATGRSECDIHGPGGGALRTDTRDVRGLSLRVASLRKVFPVLSYLFMPTRVVAAFLVTVLV